MRCARAISGRCCILFAATAKRASAALHHNNRQNTDNTTSTLFSNDSQHCESTITPHGCRHLANPEARSTSCEKANDGLCNHKLPHHHPSRHPRDDSPSCLPSITKPDPVPPLTLADTEISKPAQPPRGRSTKPQAGQARYEVGS